MPFVDLSNPKNSNDNNSPNVNTQTIENDQNMSANQNQNNNMQNNDVSNNTNQNPVNINTNNTNNNISQNNQSTDNNNNNSTIEPNNDMPDLNNIENQLQNDNNTGNQNENQTNNINSNQNNNQSSNNNLGNNPQSSGVKETKGPPLPNQQNQQNKSNNNITNQNNADSKVPGMSSLPPLESVLGDSNNQNKQSQQMASQPPQQNQNTENMPQNNNNAPTNQTNSNADMNTDKLKGSGKVNSARVLSNFDSNTATITDFLSYTIASNASDLHLGAEDNVFIRVDGNLRKIPGEALSRERAQELIYALMEEDQIKKFENEKELDFSYEHESGNRFRVNTFYKEGVISSALRLIPNKVRTISELNLPDILYDFTKVPHGLVLVTGPTGSGKSTSIAAMIQEINVTRSEHILTIEDPIEYIFPKRKSLVEQREIGKDTTGWKRALKSVLRQDPNVVLVGEMRDYETIESTVTVAETGHLVFATLHTNSASETMDRIIDVFPEGQQSQIRAQLANVITAVVAQRLVPVKGGGRMAIHEIMIGNSAIRNAIREGKTYQIDNIIQTNTDVGMKTLESSLAEVVRSGKIDIETAQRFTTKPDQLMSLLNENNL